MNWKFSKFNPKISWNCTYVLYSMTWPHKSSVFRFCTTIFLLLKWFKNSPISSSKTANSTVDDKKYFFLTFYNLLCQKLIVKKSAFWKRKKNVNFLEWAQIYKLCR